MTTIDKHLELLGANGNKLIGYAIIGGMLNLIDGFLDEMKDEELSFTIEKLRELTNNKQTELLNMNI